MARHSVGRTLRLDGRACFSGCETEDGITYIRFTIPGNPVPKARPRFANGHAFTPEKTRSYEEMVR